MEPGQRLVPETAEGNSVLIIVKADDGNEWLYLVPALLREHLISKIPDDGKQYVARVTWTVGEV